MKSAIHRTLSFTLALLVLVSTLSFTVDKHFCGSYLVDKAVFSKAKTCGMESPASSETGISESKCCTHQQILVEGQDELKISFNSLDLDQQLFLVSYSFSYLNLFEEELEKKTPFQFYSPPLLVRDIQVLDGVFLI